MALLERTADMKPPLGFNVGGVRFFWSVEVANVEALPISINTCSPSSSVGTDAKHSRTFVCFHCFSDVLKIHLPGGFAQVFNSVVGFFTIDMVKMLRREASKNVQPSKSMGFVRPAFNDDVDVAKRGLASSNRPCFVFLPRHDTPEYSGVLVVVQQLAQALRGKIGFSHEAAPSLIGQRLASVTSASRASLF